MNTFQFFIDGIKIRNAVFPLKYGKFLDEQLDYATVTLTRINRKSFALGSAVKIVVNSDSTSNEVRYQQSKEFHYVVSADRSRETPVGSGMYRHDLTIIEPTKLLEIPLETLCFTNASGNIYTANAKAPDLETQIEEF